MQCKACLIEDPTVRTYFPGISIEHTLCKACHQEMLTPPVPLYALKDWIHAFKFKKRLGG